MFDNGDAMSDKPMMTRLTDSHDQDREFDIEFWQRQGDTAIAAAAWEMVVLHAAQRGISEDQLRLQRSVARIRRVRRVYGADLEQGH